MPFGLFTVASDCDQHLARVSIESLSDQARMEMLIDMCTRNSKADFQDCGGAYLDVCDWHIVKCDASRKVLEVSISIFEEMSGTIQLDFLPESVTRALISHRNFRGTLDTAKLSQKVEDLVLEENSLEGKVDLTTLPHHLRIFNISRNKFTGKLNLTQLPATLKDCKLNNNKFQGTVDLSHLPSSLQCLMLSHNRLEGSLVLQNLPVALKYFAVDWNRLSGEFSLDALPAGAMVDAGYNKMCGTAVVHSSIYGRMVGLYKNAFVVVVDESGKAHAEADAMLRGEDFMLAQLEEEMFLDD